MFDYGFWILMYFLAGFLKVQHIFLAPPHQRPFWATQKTLFKEALIVIFWPFQIVSNLVANSQFGLKPELKQEGRYFFIVLIAGAFTTLAYFFSSLFTEIAWLKMIISISLLFVLMKTLTFLASLLHN